MENTDVEDTMTIKNNTVATNIRRIREGMKWTQQLLADQTGVEVRSVQRAEAGKAGPETILAIAHAFNIPVEWLEFDPVEARRHLDEMNKTHTLVGLVVIDRGSTLGKMLAAANSLLVDCVPLDDDAHEDKVAELKDYLRDCMDIWDEVDAAAQRGFEKDIHQIIDALRQYGLVVTAGTEDLRVRHDPNVAAMTFHNLCVIISKFDAPRMAVWLPRTRPVQFA